jgi:hypothetical protein
LHNPHPRPAAKTQIDVDIAYHNHNAVVVVRRFGRDFPDSIIHTTQSLRGQGIRTIYVDLPLDNPCVDHGTTTLESLSFLFSGLMPLFHNDCDYIRMQHTLSDLDLDMIATFSPMAGEIKKRIRSETQWITRRRLNDSTFV